MVLSFLVFLHVLSFLFFFCLSFFFVSWLHLLFVVLFLFSELASDVRMRSDRYYVLYTRGSLPWVGSDIVGFSRRK